MKINYPSQPTIFIRKLIIYNPGYSRQGIGIMDEPESIPVGIN